MTGKLYYLAAITASLAAVSDALVLSSPNGAVRFRVLVDQGRLLDSARYVTLKQMITNFA